MNKKQEKEMIDESKIATQGTELGRLDQLEKLVADASEALHQIREQASVLGNLLFKINQAVILRRIVVLQAESKDKSD